MVPIDSSYLLTCGKDSRTICWDTVSGEIVAELPAGTNWNFDVHWYPKIPGVISASSFDGKIGIYNIEVIFVDADQIVRTDMGELYDMDLRGRPLAYTPFCDNNKEMDGYRFWDELKDNVVRE